jgi:hypothetical protein
MLHIAMNFFQLGRPANLLQAKVFNRTAVALYLLRCFCGVYLAQGGLS